MIYSVEIVLAQNYGSYEMCVVNLSISIYTFVWNPGYKRTYVGYWLLREMWHVVVTIYELI